ncbi:MAG: hypothetical protein G01um101430_321 [Parcubacteria group bacterium Gr01-1014_30]|nr:MAG: hypothetical protein G01um101430_321 [Parcubacteria group bacterium Gr01-1014_30]
MLTIFTTTKPSIGEIGFIQRNAINSWRLLRPKPQILLFDNEKGAKKLAKDLKITHVPEVRKNEYGTPLVRDIFEKAQSLAKNRILAYVNADIILMQDFMEAISRIKFDKFVLVGQRRDIDIKKNIRFQKGWREKLRKIVAKESKLHGPSGIDYFVFPKGFFSNIPNFALGRTLWDNWFLYKAWISGATLIDATEVITAIHQNHKVHLPRGHKKNVWKGPEAKMNQTLAGGLSRAFTIRDCSKLLTKEGLENPKVDFYRIFSAPFRYYDKLPALKPFLFFGWLVFLIWRKIKIIKT